MILTNYSALSAMLLFIFVHQIHINQAYQGKCVDDYGRDICDDDELCIKGRKTLCDPPYMSGRCKCKRNRVKGCVDLLGNLVCGYLEECLITKSGQPCTRKTSSKCRCQAPATTTTAASTTTGVVNTPSPEGCRVYSGQDMVIIPPGSSNHPVEGTCWSCSCQFSYATFSYQSNCRKDPRCPTFRLVVGK